MTNKITVKIIPPDGKWETACSLINHIQQNSAGFNLEFIVEDVFKSDLKNHTFNNLTAHFGDGHNFINNGS